MVNSVVSSERISKSYIFRYCLINIPFLFQFYSIFFVYSVLNFIPFSRKVKKEHQPEMGIQSVFGPVSISLTSVSCTPTLRQPSCKIFSYLSLRNLTNSKYELTSLYWFCWQQLPEEWFSFFAKFSEKLTFLTPCMYICVLGGKKCQFFGKFCELTK